MNAWDLKSDVERTLTSEMGYSQAEARSMVLRHGDRICDAIYYLHRRLAMQIELLEVKRAEGLD